MTTEPQKSCRLAPIQRIPHLKKFSYILKRFQYSTLVPLLTRESVVSIRIIPSFGRPSILTEVLRGINPLCLANVANKARIRNITDRLRFAMESPVILRFPRHIHGQPPSLYIDVGGAILSRF